MRRVRIETIKRLERTGKRPAGYAADLISIATRIEDGFAYIVETTYDLMVRKYRGESATVPPPGSIRRPCAGCGGDRYDPMILATPQGHDQLLRELQ